MLTLCSLEITLNPWTRHKFWSVSRLHINRITLFWGSMTKSLFAPSKILLRKWNSTVHWIVLLHKLLLNSEEQGHPPSYPKQIRFTFSCLKLALIFLWSSPCCNNNSSNIHNLWLRNDEQLETINEFCFQEKIIKHLLLLRIFFQWLC